MKKLIVLLTDYGYRDPYVGVVKGVIKSINPEAEVIDLTHGIERHNILEAAVILAVSAKYFPRNTVFVVVVDPGVGSSRRSILIETSNYILLGPDNGCLTLLAEQDGVKRVFDISNSKYKLPEVSYTFHGRDIFAPVAAWISKGVPLEEVGEEISYSEIVKLTFEKPIVNERDKSIKATVVYIDVFGNIMTNISNMDLSKLNPSFGSKINIEAGASIHTCVFEASFSRVPEGELACYINSWGYFEIAVNKGNAAAKLRVKQGDGIVIKQVEQLVDNT
ncbi:MAG: S-adenosyl-l-methionine hydroxide adenosyltransferase family protein [Desulfurococcaceae archaeon]